MAESLNSTTTTPISQLNPQLPELPKRSIRATVTLIWPYSSFKQNFTLRLAESDVRLRRANGEVRVSFQGSSARTVHEAGIGSGDEVRLSLDGAEWVEDGSYASTPGRGIQWELRFTERLLLEIRQSDSQNITTVDIDHPPPREPASVAVSPVLQHVASPPKPVGRLDPQTETNEWSSPAFMKRARLSYGSLMESSYDMFADEDGTIPGKGRKRPKFGRGSGSWRYSSRSPSPEAEKYNEEDKIESVPNPVSGAKPPMLDEACQTTDLEFDVAASLEELSRQGVAAIGVPRLPAESMAPPPRPQLSIDSEPQFITGPEKVDEVQSEPPSSPLLRPVPSDGLSLVSPLVSPSPGGFYGHIETALDWNKQPTPSLATTEAPDIQATDLDTSGLKSFHSDYFDVADQYGHWQTDVAAHDESGVPVPSLAIDPALNGVIEHGYPELDTENSGDIERHSGQYGEHPLITLPTYSSGDGFPVYHGGDGIHTDHYPEPDFGHAPEDEDASQHGNLLAPSADKPSHHSSIAVSRSQSVQSGLIDLTEESEDEEEADGMEAPAGMPRSQQLSSIGIEETELDPEDEDEDDDLQDEYGNVTARPYEDEEISEDELADDDDGPERYPHGYYEPNQATSGAHDSSRFQNEYEDEEDEEDEEDDDEDGDDEKVRGDYEEYEEDEEGEEEDDEEEDVEMEPRRRSALEAPKQPEVIELLSSDEEDESGVHDIIEEDEEPDSSEEGSADEEEDLADEEVDDEEQEEEEEDNEVPEHIVPDTVDDEEESASGDDDHADLVEIEKAGISSSQLHPEDFRKDDTVSAVEAAADIKEKEAPEDIQPTPFGLDGHQELEAADIEMDSGWVIVHEPSAHNIIGAEVVTSMSEMEQVPETIPTILVENKPDDNLGMLVDENRRSPSFDEEWHDAPDVPLSGQIISDDIVAGENTEKIVTLDIEVGDTVSDTVSVDKEMNTTITRDHRDDSEDIFYPVLPLAQDEGVDDTIVTDEAPADDSQSVKVTNGQLPTPDATQTAADLFTQESFNSTAPSAVGASFHIPTEEGSIEKQVGQVSNMLETETEKTTIVAVDPVIVPPPTPRRHMRTRSGVSQQSPKTDRSSSVIADDLTSLHGQDASSELVVDAPTKLFPIPLETPKRLRRTRSTVSQQSPVTDTSSIIVDDHLASQGYDASAQLALEALESPTKVDLHPTSTAALRIKLSRSLRTDLQDLFTPLKNVRHHLDRRIDVLAIATTSTRPEEAIRAKNGPRHYLLRFNITDPTLTNAVTEVQVFRPFRDVLPAVKAGDGVLLRNFLAKSERGRGFPLRSSDEGCSWAVFQSSGDVEMRGAPVEFGDVERDHIAGLKMWFDSLDETARAKLDKANSEKGVEASPVKAAAKSH